MNNEIQDPQVLIKASLTKTRLTKLMKKRPDFQLKLKLNALDSILCNLSPEESNTPIISQQPSSQRTILNKAKEVITQRKQKINFESLYLDIKKDTQEDDAFNQLILNNLDRYNNQQETIQIKPKQVVKHKSEEQIIYGYQMLPKIAISNRLKRKKETIDSLNHQFKINKQLIKQQTLRELQQMKLPQIFEGITIKDVKQKENLQKYVLKSEFYHRWHKQLKQTKPSSIVQSFVNMNQYLLDSADYLDQVSRLERKEIQEKFESLNEFLGNQYQKLKIKTDPN